jgi:hypothetical protein
MPSKVKIYRKNGEVAEVYTADARAAVSRHPDDWSMREWPKERPEPATPPVDPNLPRAVHRGGGSWAVMRGEEVVEPGLTKDEAEAKVFEMLKASDEAGA